MDQYQEAKLKAMAAQECAQQQAGSAKMAKSLSGTPGMDKQCRMGLADRIHRRLQHAQQEALRSQQLQELQYLLEKNPEVARILDLIEAVGQ